MAQDDDSVIEEEEKSLRIDRDQLRDDPLHVHFVPDVSPNPTSVITLEQVEPQT